MKKWIVVVSSFLVSIKSFAWVGYFTMQPWVSVAGLVVAFSATPLVATSHPGDGRFAAGITQILVGAAIMDGENGYELQFQELTASQMSSLGVNAADYEVYASELEEVQAIQTQVSSEIARRGISDVEKAKEMYQDQFRSVSPETRRVMTRILQQRR
jgi:hypothetical protein